MTRGGRSFHYRYRRTEEDVKDALARAVEAWATQDEWERRQAEEAKATAEIIKELEKFLNGNLTGFCPLIRRQDSYQAGNCQPGTEEWVIRRGWRQKTFVPGVALISYLGDGRVRRVALSLKQELAG